MTLIDSLCPSCGREIGTERKHCIYCNAARANRKKIARIQLLAFLLFLIAAAYFFGAIFSKPVYDNIQDLDKNMNFERVRIKGKVIGKRKFPGKYEKQTRIVLTIVQESKNKGADIAKGQKDFDKFIRVKAEGNVGTAILQQDSVPEVGDIVDVSASLYAGADYRVLSLNTPQSMRIIERHKKIKYQQTTVAQLLKNPQSFRNKLVVIKKAKITRCYRSYKIRISDITPKNSLLVFGVNPKAYKPGISVSVRGRFIYYEKGGYWEIKTRRNDKKAVVILSNKSSGTR